MPEIKNYPASMHVCSVDSHKERDYIIEIKLEVSTLKDTSVDDLIHDVESSINKERDIERKGTIIEMEVLETSVVY